MRTLAIETSCDDTSLAIVEKKGDKFLPINVLLYSQIEKHKKFGGVVPELASRLHEEKIIDLLEEIGKKSFESIDFISYTSYPGLPGSLLVGKALANTLSLLLNKPKIGINHIHGHIFSLFIERSLNDIKFPLLVLTVSGGHNEIYFVGKKLYDNIEHYVYNFANNYGLDKESLISFVGDFIVVRLGFTLDDAAGEAFDKVSKMLGGPYPGGKWIYDLAMNFSSDSKLKFKFPRIWLKKNEFNFSFSGLKAQVNYKIKELKQKGYLSDEVKSMIAYEFQEAVVETLGKKLLKASKYFSIPNIAVVGGVSANQRLKDFIKSYVDEYNIYNFYYPVKNLYSTDNAAMIGVVGLLHNKI